MNFSAHFVPFHAISDVFTFTKRVKKCKALFSVWPLFQPWSVRCVCAGTCCPDLSTGSVNQHVLWLTGRTGGVKATFTESLNTQRPCITKTIKIKEAKRLEEMTAVAQEQEAVLLSWWGYWEQVCGYIRRLWRIADGKICAKQDGRHTVWKFKTQNNLKDANKDHNEP